ncbi:PglL family O-oligosaccharyltransferase [Nitrincola iocasae]|uniref:Virulence factor membrane-bound polymerase C-terminal domain-containing protein n=1 Tax=Nitrincola iocasae TaxID=2614693 RepID=A0A5J6LCJ5_9GAMM|nr:O-antigen ligase family protein [Nitrincola iocasae]QEW05941.1 hypothetical protein F5I99_05245 [Nitrincola iocasae]
MVRLNLISVLIIVMAAIFFVISILLPNHYLPWLAAYQEFSSFFYLILLLLFSVLFLKKLKITSVIVFFIVLSALPLIQHLFGIIFFIGDAWIVTAYLLFFAISVLVGFNLFHSDIESKKIIVIVSVLFIFVAIISTWISLWQWLMLPGSIWIADMPIGGRPFANMGQPNNLATLLCLGLGGVYYLYDRKYLNAISCSFLTFFIIIGIVLTQSRTPWISAFWVFGVFGYFNLRFSQLPDNFRLSFKWVVCWVLIYFLLVVSLPFVSDFLMISNIDLLDRAKSMERLEMYLQFFTAIVNGPFWGYGWNQITVAQVNITSAYPVPIPTQYTHNFLLDLLVWNGPFIGSILIVFLGVWFFYLACNVYNKESFFALISICFVLTHAMLEYPHAYAFFIFPVGILLGGLHSETNPAVVSSVSKVHGFIFVFFLFFLFSVVWSEYRVVEENNRVLRFEIAKIGRDRTKDYVPDVFILTQLKAFHEFARMDPVSGMSHRDIDFMRRVVYRYPYPSILYRYALALKLNDERDKSEFYLKILKDLHGDDKYLEAIHIMSETFPDEILVN